MDIFTTRPLFSLYAVYLLIASLVTAYLYYRDKRAAQKKKWRIPERTLLLANVVGGTFGAWVVFLGLHHKTRHPTFWVVQTIALVLHSALLVWLLVM